MLFTQTLLFASLLLSILASPLHFKRQDSISAQAQATPTLSNQAAVPTPARTAIPAGGGAQPRDSTPTSSNVDDASQDDTEDPEQDVSNDSSPHEVQDAQDYSPDYSSVPDNAQVAAAGDSPSTPSDDSSTPSNESTDDSAPSSDPSAPSDSSAPDDPSSDGSSSDDSTPSESTPDKSASDSSSPDGTTGTDGAGNDNDENYFAGDDWFDGTK